MSPEVVWTRRGSTLVLVSGVEVEAVRVVAVSRTRKAVYGRSIFSV